MSDCLPFIRYVIFFTIFVISFVCIFIRNLEVIGFGMMYAINIIMSIFLSSDLLGSLRKTDPGVFIIAAMLLMNFIAFTMIIVTLAHLHLKYSKKDEKIYLSNENKYKMYVFKVLFITVLTILGVLSAFFFAEDPSRSFFDYLFTEGKINPIVKFIIFISKIILSFAGLGIASYNVYLSKTLMSLKYSQL